jgi:hypothetical protein
LGLSAGGQVGRGAFKLRFFCPQIEKFLSTNFHESKISEANYHEFLQWCLLSHLWCEMDELF